MVHGAIEGALQTMTTQMRRMAIGSWSMTLFVSYTLPSIITQALSTPSLQKRMQDDTLVKGVESMPMLKPKLHSRVSAIIIIWLCLSKPLKDTGWCSYQRYRKQALQPSPPAQDEDSDPLNPSFGEVVCLKVWKVHLSIYSGYPRGWHRAKADHIEAIHRVHKGHIPTGLLHRFLYRLYSARMDCYTPIMACLRRFSPRRSLLRGLPAPLVGMEGISFILLTFDFYWMYPVWLTFFLTGSTAL